MRNLVLYQVAYPDPFPVFRRGDSRNLKKVALRINLMRRIVCEFGEGPCGTESNPYIGRTRSNLNLLGWRAFVGTRDGPDLIPVGPVK